jgi:hypothetical protein
MNRELIQGLEPHFNMGKDTAHALMLGELRLLLTTQNEPSVPTAKKAG